MSSEATKSAASDLISQRTAAYQQRAAWFEGVDPEIRKASAALMHGAVDLHVHCDPSPARRSLDAFKAAEQASDAGMRAILIKEHHAHTEETAWLAQRHAKITFPFEIFGSTWLNWYTGGWNPFAVDKAILFGSRLIAPPTVAARAQLRRNALQGPHPAESQVTTRSAKQGDAVRMLDDDGRLLPEVLECLDLIAEAGNVVLGSGHSDMEEIRALVPEAKRRGVNGFCLTHATIYTAATPIELRDFCRETGAVCEFVGTEIYNWPGSLAEDLRTIGLEYVTLSTDGGIYYKPPPVVEYEWLLTKLLQAGLTEEEVAAVSHDTPRRLFELR